MEGGGGARGRALGWGRSQGGGGGANVLGVVGDVDVGVVGHGDGRVRVAGRGVVGAQFAVRRRDHLPNAFKKKIGMNQEKKKVKRYQTKRNPVKPI